MGKYVAGALNEPETKEFGWSVFSLIYKKCLWVPTISCFFKFARWLNALSQLLHLNGFSPASIENKGAR
jgi:hypothetical protein